MPYQTVPDSVRRFMDRITELCGAEHADWAENFNAAFANTLTTTVHRHADGTTFLLTGDIPAMWLRDSTAQVRPYLPIAAEDDDLADMIEGLVRLQFRYIGIDPYANAFNEEPNGRHLGSGRPLRLLQPVAVGAQVRARLVVLPDPAGMAAVRQHRSRLTVRRHVHLRHAARPRRAGDRAGPRPLAVLLHPRLLDNDGRGTPVAPTGMTWSGFRPSDDACTYHYLVPANMFAAVVMGYAERIFTEIVDDAALAARARALRESIDAGLRSHGTMTNAAGETIWAYEVDGLGHALLMDDSNVPSLMAAPYLGYCAADDPLYLSTRRTLLSAENPFYYEGAYAKGIGSPHTPPRYVWPIALSIQGLTSPDKAEKAAILDNLVAIDAGTHLMHEGVCVDDPTQYTREWFSWSNMMFCELVMDYFDIRVKH